MTDLTTLPDRALSIRQPWAWAIMNAGKTIENRSRRTHYRGPICIHAGIHNNAGYHISAGLDIMRATNGLRQPPYREKLQRGGIIGTAEIVDCVDTSDSPWFSGPYGLVLASIQPVEFIQVKGALGLFNWRRNLVEESRP